jgi:hypothetical protein
MRLYANSAILMIETEVIHIHPNLTLPYVCLARPVSAYERCP